MRFVIHDHIIENRHYDLMIETEDQDFLITWRIMPSDLDILLKGNEIEAVRIQEHKKFFLDYEGSLSSGNGSVAVFDRGISRVVKNEKNCFVFELYGQIFKGTVKLIPINNDLFNIQYFQEYTNL